MCFSGQFKAQMVVLAMINVDMLLAMALVLIGSFVQTSIGFGLAIVVAPFLFVLNPDYIPAPICLIALFISLGNAFKHKQQLRIGALKMAMLGRIPGSLLGGVMLMFFSQQLLELYLGCLVLLAVGFSLSSLQIQPTSFKMSMAGFFSGVFGTSAAIGGPPMALLLQHEQAQSLRANLSAFFVFSSILSLMIQLGTGYLTLEHLRLTLPLLPAAWLGHCVAYWQCSKWSTEKMRYPILCLCFISGATAIWHGLA